MLPDLFTGLCSCLDVAEDPGCGSIADHACLALPLGGDGRLP